jgi:lipopolysaccharide biosynthesis protein
VNDSILGPNENFGTLIANIRASREDFIALTANWIDVYHAQSYFFVYQNDALNSQCVKELWNSLPDYPTKVDVIRNCEQHQLAFLTNQGLSHKIMFPLLEQVAKLSSIEKVGFNPTHHAWRELLNLRFPFLKADLFYRSSQSLYGWNEFFRAEVIQWQLTELLSSRAAMTTTKIHSEHRSLAVVKFLIGSETFFKLRARWKRLKAERRSGIRVLW